MIQWNADLARALVCREEEKRALAPLIRRLMDLDRKARSAGFQSLEEELPSINDPLLAVGLRLVIEGLSGEPLEDILATYLLAEERSGWPFLKACVVVEGLLALAESDDPALMARKLVAYYGAERALGALEELEEAEPESEPTTRTPEPSTRASEPSARASEPNARASEPSARASEPSARASLAPAVTEGR